MAAVVGKTKLLEVVCYAFEEKTQETEKQNLMDFKLSLVMIKS